LWRAAIVFEKEFMCFEGFGVVGFFNFPFEGEEM